MLDELIGLVQPAARPEIDLQSLQSRETQFGFCAIDGIEFKGSLLLVNPKGIGSLSLCGHLRSGGGAARYLSPMISKKYVLDGSLNSTC